MNTWTHFCRLPTTKISFNGNFFMNLHSNMDLKFHRSEVSVSRFINQLTNFYKLQKTKTRRLLF